MSDLRGCRILVTREASKAEETAAAIRARGGIPVVFPTLEIAPAADLGPFRNAVAGLGEFDLVAVASATAASILGDTCREMGISLADARFAAVGEATAERLRIAGARDVVVSLQPDGAGLAAALADVVAGGRRVLVPGAEGGRPDLAEGLARAGAAVVSVVAYRTRTRRPGPGELEALLSGGRPHAATFFSPSAVEGFVEILGADRAYPYLDGLTVASIGRTTAGALEGHGIRGVRVACRPTVGDLLDCLRDAVPS
jgi:uroporphyrinogen-III synthase